MDEQIWKEFPEELLEGVIARLPIAAFLRFRLVSRKWKSLLESPIFLQRWAEVVQQNQPLFFGIFFQGNGSSVVTGALYDPCMKKWHHSTRIPFRGGPCTSAYAGGLVCYLDYRSFHVGNPLTHTWKSWNATSSFSTNSVTVGMVIIPDQHNLVVSAQGSKIVWVDGEGNYGVYDSLNDSASCTGKTPTNIDFFPGYRSRSVSIDSVVYFLGRPHQGMISYDVVTGAWEQLPIRKPYYSAGLSLAECGGRLLLLGVVEHGGGELKSIRVWELEKAKHCWTEVDRMPISLCSDLIGKFVVFTCHGNRRLLVFSAQNGEIDRTFTYDVVSREWTEVPRCSPPGHRGRQSRIVGGFGFLPCLYASP